MYDKYEEEELELKMHLADFDAVMAVKNKLLELNARGKLKYTREDIVTFEALAGEDLVTRLVKLETFPEFPSEVNKEIVGEGFGIKAADVFIDIFAFVSKALVRLVSAIMKFIGWTKKAKEDVKQVFNGEYGKGMNKTDQDAVEAIKNRLRKRHGSELAMIFLSGNTNFNAFIATADGLNRFTNEVELFLGRSKSLRQEVKDAIADMDKMSAGKLSNLQSKLIGDIGELKKTFDSTSIDGSILIEGQFSDYKRAYAAAKKKGLNGNSTVSVLASHVKDLSTTKVGDKTFEDAVDLKKFYAMRDNYRRARQEIEDALDGVDILEAYTTADEKMPLSELMKDALPKIKGDPVLRDFVTAVMDELKEANDLFKEQVTACKHIVTVLGTFTSQYNSCNSFIENEKERLFV